MSNRFLDPHTALVAAANLALILAGVLIPGLLAVLGGVLIAAVVLVSLLWYGDRAEMMADRARWGRPEKGVEGRKSRPPWNFTCGTCGKGWPQCGHETNEVPRSERGG